MHRRLSAFVKPSAQAGSPLARDESILEDSASTKISEAAHDASLSPPNLTVKRLDYYQGGWSGSWKYREMSSKVIVEERPMGKAGDNDPWKNYCFVVVRTLTKYLNNVKATFKVVVKSEYLIKVCRDVIVSWPGISWNSDPLEIEPEVFLTFYFEFISYRERLVAEKTLTEEEKHALSTVTVLIDWLEQDYRTTIATIKNLTAHGEITFALLYAVLVPRSILVAQCAVTGEMRAFRLDSYIRTAIEGVPIYRLSCSSVDLVDKQAINDVAIGRVQTFIDLHAFRGTVKITSLDAYPVQYHPASESLRASLIERGRKWLSLCGVHHKQYSGLASVRGACKSLKHNVEGRIMVDRATFRRINPNYSLPVPVPLEAPEMDPNANPNDANINPFSCGLGRGIIPPTPPPFAFGQHHAVMHAKEVFTDELSEEELLLAATVVYGFSFSDKVWLEFNVQNVAEVEWNEDAFANLVLPAGRKALLQSLIEAHHKSLGFDDFIKGKGQGLVINLFGPPGVGKTFSAEATSEFVKTPLYVVGAGDLGTNAFDLDRALSNVFDLATSWKATVLIDEADVFMERRSLHDLERNAMVAVFLRHLEYYRGIVFLTTNRVKAYDEAFLSRIHLALHFDLLSPESKAQVLRSFLAKAGVEFTEEQISEMSTRNVNGRQIKNAARTAHSLALGRGEKVQFSHFVETLDAMDEFTTQFRLVGNAKYEAAA